MQNAAFQRKAGRLPGAVELLQVAGFAQEPVQSTSHEAVVVPGSEAVLRLKRSDPGLLWLVMSAVEGAREHLSKHLGSS